MLKRLLSAIVCCVAVCGLAEAGDHFFFGGWGAGVYGGPWVSAGIAPVYGPPVVYAPPVVAYQAAYYVPTPTVAVSPYPIPTVAYGTQVFAPMVPMAVAPPVPRYSTVGYYLAPSYPVGVAVPYYRARYPREIEIDIDYHRRGFYSLDVDFD